jgi:hypothetical protein
MVRKEMYMNQVRIREVAMPILSPMAVHTPNTCHSMKNFIRFMRLNYKKIVHYQTTTPGFYVPQMPFNEK